MEPLLPQPEAMAPAFLPQPTPQMDRRANPRQSPAPRRRGRSRGTLLPFFFSFFSISLSLSKLLCISVITVFSRARILSPNSSRFQERARKGSFFYFICLFFLMNITFHSEFSLQFLIGYAKLVILLFCGSIWRLLLCYDSPEYHIPFSICCFHIYT